jgi:hypothetical protein
MTMFHSAHPHPDNHQTMLTYMPMLVGEYWYVRRHDGKVAAMESSIRGHGIDLQLLFTSGKDAAAFIYELENNPSVAPPKWVQL